MRRIFFILSFVLALTAVAPAADGVLPNRLAKAQPGEWLKLRDVAGEHSGEYSRFSVVEKKGSGDDAVIVMRRERLDSAGDVVDSSDIDINLARYESRLRELEDKAKQVSRERLTVKGKELVVYAISWDDENRDGEPREFKMWISDEVPVGGMVKSWSSDPAFPASELVDFGTN